MINQIFTKSGFELYVVGGAVRDALNKVQPKDYDLATDAKPQEILAMFNAVGGYGIKEAGATFPVVHVATPDHIPNTDIGLYEIATFRLEQAESKNKVENFERFLKNKNPSKFLQVKIK